jgi:hypothetical protein
MEPTQEPMRSWNKISADRLADEVAVLVRRGVIDSRSLAADALLDYRDPPFTERSERLAGPEDGTGLLCQVLYGRPARPRDYLGSDARMLHDAADEITRLRAAIRDVLLELDGEPVSAKVLAKRLTEALRERAIV